MAKFIYRRLEEQSVKCLAKGLEETAKLEPTNIRDVRTIVGAIALKLIDENKWKRK